MKLKRFFQNIAKRKKLLIITAVVAVLGLVGGIGSWWVSRNSPDRLLYESIALDPFAADPYTIQESLDTKGGDIRLEAFFKKDGTLRVQGTLACSVMSPTYGEIDLKVSLLQVDESAYMRIDKLSFAGMEDEELESKLNSIFTEKVIGKWILLMDDNPAYLGYKEYGVMFSGITAASNKMSAREVASKLKESKTITILDRKKISVAGRDATEYSLLLRRSAYSQFIDSIEPRYGYSDDVLDTIFTDDTIEGTVVIDNKTKKALSARQSVENQCSAFLNQFDPNAAQLLPRKMEVHTRTSPSGTADKATKPTESITVLEYFELLSEE